MSQYPEHFKNPTESNIYDWLRAGFDESLISFPELELSDGKRPDFAVSLGNGENLIIESKEIENADQKLQKYERDGEILPNLYGKFEQYGQLKQEHYGSSDDIRVLILGSDPIYEDNCLDIETHEPANLKFLMDSIYGTSHEFTNYSDETTAVEHIGIFNVLPNYISGVGFICRREEIFDNYRKRLFVRLFLNLGATNKIERNIFGENDDIVFIGWPSGIID